MMQESNKNTSLRLGFRNFLGVKMEMIISCFASTYFIRKVYLPCSSLLMKNDDQPELIH